MDIRGGAIPLTLPVLRFTFFKGILNYKRKELRVKVAKIWQLTVIVINVFTSPTFK